MSRAGQFQPLPEDVFARWSRFGRTGSEELYVNLLGLQIEELRTDYCRMRMPFKTSLKQAAGVVHGGAIAGLLDSVVVPVVGQAYPLGTRFSTVDMHIQFMSALIDDDAIAEGWIVRRGRSVVFVEAEAVSAARSTVVARAVMTYNVSPPPSS
jgi:uncharacterized protein (TIGR00369 family)